MDDLLARYNIVSNYLNNQTEEQWQKMLEQISELEENQDNDS
ncbi:MAG: hypothetical protein ACXAC2_16655 [Candidatus Kariarchaeaceae archaeon]|jgi:hypothetical protein